VRVNGGTDRETRGGERGREPRWLRDGEARWPSVADMTVPAVLAVTQLALTWLIDDSAKDRLSQGEWMIATSAVVLSALALLWRRRAPVPVLIATVLIGDLGALAIGVHDTLVGGVADGVALYSVAVHRGRRQAVVGMLLAYFVALACYLPRQKGMPDLLSTEVADVFYYAVVTTLGQLRRQQKARRRALAARLEEADRERRAAAESERERLARDLHDVAGHHLSAVVVHSGAAARLDSPDLTVEALRTAADTGRDVLKSLSRLVDVVGPQVDDGGLEALLPPLCHGLSRLGIPISLNVEGRARRLPPDVVTAAYRIVQESLTNAMRYASGRPVNVEVRYVPGALELRIDNEAAEDDGAVPPLGTGRGIVGMTERAAGVGGTLDAGPVESGGWSVRAVLPTSSPRRGPGWPEVLDAIAVTFSGVLPIMLAFTPPDQLMKGRSIAEGVLVALAVLLRALPLWWRRRAPYTTLLVLAVIDSVWMVTAAFVDPDLSGLILLGAPAAAIAVYSVGAYARAGRHTWPAALIGGLPWGLVMGVSLVIDKDPSGPGPVVFVYGLAAGGLFTTLILLPFWAWGKTVARRGRRWETNALETMAARTGEAVLAERHRVAMGLRGTVLDHTSRLVRAAEAGLAGSGTDAQAALDVVTTQARAALIDMRELLDAMEEHAVEDRGDGLVEETA
jgi:signal transduction histidine kinase